MKEITSTLEELEIKEAILQPTDQQKLQLPIGSYPFAIKCIQGKIRLYFVCDIKETVTEEVKIDINSYRQKVTFNPKKASYLGTFKFPMPNGIAILHAFITMKANNIIIPTLTKNLHDLVKGGIKA